MWGSWLLSLFHSAHDVFATYTWMFSLIQLLVNKIFFHQSSFYLSNFAHQCRRLLAGVLVWVLLAWIPCSCVKTLMKSCSYFVHSFTMLCAMDLSFLVRSFVTIGNPFSMSFLSLLVTIFSWSLTVSFSLLQNSCNLGVLALGVQVNGFLRNIY